MASTIKVSGIKGTGVANHYVGDLNIHFSQDSLLRALNPIEVSILFTVDPDDPANARTILTCGAYDNISALLAKLTDLQGRLLDLEEIEPSTLKCLPTLAQAMKTAGVTDQSPCPAGQQCQSQSVRYQLASGNTCTPASKSVCASCVAPPPSPPSTSKCKNEWSDSACTRSDGKPGKIPCFTARTWTCSSAPGCNPAIPGCCACASTTTCYPCK